MMILDQSRLQLDERLSYRNISPVALVFGLFKSGKYPMNQGLSAIELQADLMARQAKNFLLKKV